MFRISLRRGALLPLAILVGGCAAAEESAKGESVADGSAVDEQVTDALLAGDPDLPDSDPPALPTPTGGGRPTPPPAGFDPSETSEPLVPASSEDCPMTDCDQSPALAPIVCPGGSSVAPTCRRTPAGACSWQLDPCPDFDAEGGLAEVEPREDELTCTTDDDCIACSFPATAGGDCVCPTCATRAVNVATCRVRQITYESCLALRCPELSCAPPVTVACSAGQCAVIAVSE